MGIGLPLEIVQEYWPDYASYEEYVENSDGYAWFNELPDWIYDTTQSWYIDPETGAIWALSLNMSNNYEMIGFTK